MFKSILLDDTYGNLFDEDECRLFPCMQEPSNESENENLFQELTSIMNTEESVDQQLSSEKQESEGLFAHDQQANNKRKRNSDNELVWQESSEGTRNNKKLKVFESDTLLSFVLEPLFE